MSEKRGFGSDNHSGVHPRYLAAITAANIGHEPSYGTDAITLEANAMMKRLFGADAETFFVFNGTAANVLSLSAIAKPFNAVLASSSSHLVNDECGAPERNLGCKIISVPTSDGKLTVPMLTPFLIRRGDQHASQISAISITQPTELGTVYSLDEIRRLSEFAQIHRLSFHMDGARLVNATAALGCTFKELVTDSGVDVLSLGGTKNGLLYGEAVIFLKPGLAPDFKYTRKQLMQLPSKTRFLAAQFLEFLATDLWRENANHANAMARRLFDGLKRFHFVSLTQTCQANAVFACFPKALLGPLRERAFFYVWNEHTFECRLMTSWDTTPDDVDRFIAAVAELGQNF